MIFSMFEDDLNQFCEAICVQLDLKNCVFDSPGKGIERAKMYLSKVARVEFPKQSAEWEKITCFRDVRHVLVHAAGYLDEKNAQHGRMKKFSERKDSGLSVEHYARDRINLAPEFLPGVLDTLRRFYDLLYRGTGDTQK